MPPLMAPTQPAWKEPVKQPEPAETRRRTGSATEPESKE